MAADALVLKHQAFRILSVDLLKLNQVDKKVLHVNNDRKWNYILKTNDLVVEELNQMVLQLA